MKFLAEKIQKLFPFLIKIEIKVFDLLVAEKNGKEFEHCFLNSKIKITWTWVPGNYENFSNYFEKIKLKNSYLKKLSSCFINATYRILKSFKFFTNFDRNSIGNEKNAFKSFSEKLEKLKNLNILFLNLK